MSFRVEDPIIELIELLSSQESSTDASQAQAKKPLAVAGNIASFGAGTDAGQVVDSGYTVDTVLTDIPSNTTLWSSKRTLNSLQYGATIFTATAPLNIQNGAAFTKAFSSGNDNLGPTTWPNIGSIYALDSTGVATITNSLNFTTYYRITFIACSLVESTTLPGSLVCQFVNEATDVPFGLIKTLRCLASPAVMTNEVYLSAIVDVAPSTSYTFDVRLHNPGTTMVTLDPDAPNDTCMLIIERVA